MIIPLIKPKFYSKNIKIRKVEKNFGKRFYPLLIRKILRGGEDRRIW